MGNRGIATPRPRIRSGGITTTFEQTDHRGRLRRWAVTGHFREHVKEIVIEHAWPLGNDEAVVDGAALERLNLRDIAMVALRKRVIELQTTNTAAKAAGG